jgi:hypothetical protein
MARRSGRVWYLIVLNGEISKELEIDPSFLTKGNYQLNCFTDDEDNRSKTTEQTIKYLTNIPLKMKLQKGGGWIGIFKKSK